MEISNFTRLKIPDLPDNKDFHVFVCYTSENAVQVRTIVNNLEELGMKCCYHERDFIPGESIMENTNDGMKRSLGMLIVLTEEFENNRYCSFELVEALHMKISENFFLVPVKLEPCNVPDCIRNISYIDAEDEEIGRVHLKVVKAFIDKEIKEEQAAKNGQTMEFALKPHTSWRMFMSRYKLEVGLEERARLRESDFEISDELLDKTEQIINKSGLVKHWYIANNSSICWIIGIFVFLLLLVIMVTFLVVLLTTSTDTPQKSVTSAGIVLAVGIPSLFLLWIGSCCVFVRSANEMNRQQKGYPNNYVENFKLQERRRLNNELWDNVTTDSKNKKRVFVFFHSGSLVIMRFNLNPCKDLFIRKLDRKDHLLRYIRSSESYEDYTDRIFKTLLRNRIHMLNDPVLALIIKHRVSTGAKCVCLLAEEWICGQ